MKFIYHPRSVEHVQWPGHPERPERVKAIVDRLKPQEPAQAFLQPEAAAKRELVRVHDEAFVERIKTMGEAPYDADTFVHKDSYQLAAIAAGTALLGAKVAFERKQDEAFAITRPPGHHAGSSFAGGFCYFNNAAIVAQTLTKEEGIRPVAVLDFDVHHGNGTEEIFRRRKDVLYLSTHQAGIFPGTGAVEEVGEAPAEGLNVNVPLPEGAGDATFALAWDRLIAPLLEAQKPKAIVVSLGLDAHYEDPIGGLTLTSNGYIDLCARAAAFARERTGRPALFVLEGGYHLEALAETVAGLSRRLQGAPTQTVLNDAHDTTEVGRAAVERALAVQSKYWGLETSAKVKGP
jgi:acetoin utilization deacetylase AcuC-like enzyme